MRDFPLLIRFNRYFWDPVRSRRGTGDVAASGRTWTLGWFSALFPLPPASNLSSIRAKIKLPEVHREGISIGFSFVWRAAALLPWDTFPVPLAPIARIRADERSDQRHGHRQIRGRSGRRTGGHRQRWRQPDAHHGNERGRRV